MIGTATPHAGATAFRLVGHTARRILLAVALLTLSLLLLACPQKQLTSKVDYSEAERGLRLAINVNEVAYNSWNKVYEGFGTLRRENKMSEARWAAVTAIDGVIVLSEADLIEGIDRSKKLLESWRKSSANLLSAESVDDVVALREREQQARDNFNASIEMLNVKSLKLRDSYAEAMTVAESVAKDGYQLPAEHVSAIRQVVKMVDQEVSRIKAGGKLPSDEKAIKKEAGAGLASSSAKMK